MIHIPIVSSNIISAGHEGDVLEVTFKHGGTYEYKGVDKDEFNKLLSAPSAGKHLNSLGITGIKIKDEKEKTQ